MVHALTIYNKCTKITQTANESEQRVSEWHVDTCAAAAADKSRSLKFTARQLELDWKSDALASWPDLLILRRCVRSFKSLARIIMSRIETQKSFEFFYKIQK
jgi:hypothetical protein